MAEFNISLQDDYPLSSDISNFLDYMFATKAKHIKRHVSFDNFHIALCTGIDSTTMYAVCEQDTRESAEMLFSEILKSHKIYPKRDGYRISCFMSNIDFGVMYPTSEQYLNAFDRLATACMDWAVSENRVLAVVSHFDQNLANGKLEMPHIHVLYERKKDHNALQDYLAELGGV